MSPTVIETDFPNRVDHQQCPHCASVVPHDAIDYGEPRSGGDAYSAYTTRKVTLDCPHCDQRSTLEIVRRM